MKPAVAFLHFSLLLTVVVSTAEEAGNSLKNPHLAEPLDVMTEVERKETMFSIPEYSIKVIEWKGLDISKELEAAFKESYRPKGNLSLKQREMLKRILFKRGKDLPLKEISRNRRWFASQRDCRTHTPGWQIRDCYFLYDCESKRIYDLSQDDSSLIGVHLSEKDYQWNVHVTDNGTTIYNQLWKEGSKEERRGGVFIVDPQNSRKFLLEHSKTGFVFPILSENGNVVALNKSHGFCVCDLDSQKVIYRGKGRLLGMNYDGRFLAMKDGGYCYRIDREIQDVAKKLNLDVGKRPLFRVGKYTHSFVLSPSGNFCAGVTGKNKYLQEIRVYVQGMKGYVVIDDVFEDKPLRIDDDGKLYAESGVYMHRDGMYYWATKGKSKRNGIRISKP